MCLDKPNEPPIDYVIDDYQHGHIDRRQFLKRATAILGLKLAYIAMPIVFSMLSIAFLWRFPITPARQRRIRRILERRAARKEALERVAG